jgi:5'-nucleotidase
MSTKISSQIQRMVSAVAALFLAGCASVNTQPVQVSLIGLNDFHGNLQPPAGSVTLGDTKVPAGGAAHLAALISQLKARNPGNTLVVAAGDMVGASPLASALFHDEPSIDALGQMGLDISSVGNHEFDKGRDELLRLQRGGCFPPSADGRLGKIGVDTCMNHGAFAGARFTYLSANVIDQRSGQTPLPATAMRTVGGVQIGFIGLTLKDTPAVVTPAGVAGLRFADEVATVNALAPQLKAAGAAAIVVLIHQGGATTATSVNDKSCPGFTGEIVGIVDRFDAAVDVVISGHTHQEYVCTRPDGRLVTQTGSYGRIATAIDLTIDPVARKVMRKSADNVVALRENKDAAIDALVTRYADLVGPITSAVVGKLAGPLTRTPNAAGESTLGAVVADAFLAASSDASYGARPAQIAFTNPGGVRADLASSLEVSYGQLYAVMPFGNHLVTLDLSGAQLLRLLEQQWEAPQPAGGRILPVSQGFSYSWDAAKPEGAAPGSGQRVAPGSMRLQGVPVDLQKTYRVTVNSYLASGGDRFSVLTEGTNAQQGVVDLDATVAWFRARGSMPAPAQERIRRLH